MSNPSSFCIMSKEKLRQTRLVVWIVLPICFQMITALTGWPFVKVVVWLAAAYCILLIILWCYLEFCLLRGLK